MDDVTMARLLAKHALGCVPMGIDHAGPWPAYYIVNDTQCWIVEDERRIFDPANVTDDAIEAADAKCFKWMLRRDRFNGIAQADIGIYTACDASAATALALATLRALGIEEEERRNHNGVASDVVHEDLEDQ